MRRRMQAGVISCRASAGSPRKTEPPLQEGESLVQFKFFTGDQNFRYQSGPLIVSNARSIDLRCGAFDGIGVDDAFRLITRRNGIETPRAILAKDAGDNRARGEFPPTIHRIRRPNVRIRKCVSCAVILNKSPSLVVVVSVQRKADPVRGVSTPIGVGVTVKVTKTPCMEKMLPTTRASPCRCLFQVSDLTRA